MTVNKLAYDDKYQGGYGITVPEGYFIRCYKQVLEYELNVKGGRVFDFGMGNGTHLNWLLQQKQKWDVFGCDISALALDSARHLLNGVDPEHFVCISPGDNIKNKTNGKFDLILANQVLYYLDQPELERVISDFHEMLNSGGVIFASMMGDENNYFGKSTPIAGTSMRRVKLQGRLNEETDINFKTVKQMLSDFSAFEKIQVGYYDSVIREDEGSTKHLTFIGRKP